MTSEAQEALLRRMAAYARRLLRDGCYGGFPSDWEPDDLVVDVVVKYVEKTRRITDRASLEQHLFGGVRSAVWALRKRNSSKVGIEGMGDREWSCPVPGPEDTAILRERHLATTDALETLALEDEELLELVTLLEESGEYTVGELMARYGWTETEARRRRRKLSRALARAEAITKEVSIA